MPDDVAIGGPMKSIREILKFDAPPSHVRLHGSEVARPLLGLIGPPLAELWERTEELPLKVKCLINVATLAALGRVELEQHVQGALRSGNTAEELVAVFMHTAVYGGVPLAVDAINVLLDVLELEDARRPGDDHEEGTGP
jgi:alkylhydroperoxidase/carboxymuconolactone decarboxylase family protein YurZ